MQWISSRGDLLAKLRTMDADAYPQEVLADEEPKYLRRQKPLEIKRRKFGRRAWKTYLIATMWTGIGVAGAWVAYASAHFLLTAPEMSLIHPEQVEIQGIQNVSRASVLEIFAADRGRSILRIHLDARRRQLEAIPWVEQATVRRALPNRVEVEITERTPIAFLRDGSSISLIDVHGVILERPLEGDFHFPVVAGIGADMPQDEREKRMQLFAGFTEQVAAARAGAMDQVSEVDLADEHDLRATISGLQPLEPCEARPATDKVPPRIQVSAIRTTPGDSQSWGQADAPVLVHFGDSDIRKQSIRR